MALNKPRVLIVYHYIAKYREPIFNELSSSTDIDFFFASDVSSNNDIELVGSEFYSSRKFFSLKNTWVLKKILFQNGFFSAFRLCKPDYVVFLADPNFISTWIYAFLLKFTKTKVVFWTHGFIRGKGLSDVGKLLFYKLADHFFLYGDKAKDKLVSLGVLPSKITVVYNSLDYIKQKILRESFTDFEKQRIRGDLFNNPHRPTLYFVGRLTFVKKLDKLLEMITMLESESIYVNLLLIGDGEAAKYLREISSRLNFKESEVTFYGKTYDESELSRLIMSSDVCVSPGEIGLSCMHSLGYGVPVVTHSNYNTQMPEYEAVIDGYNGKLFVDGDLHSMTQAVKSLILNPIRDVDINCISSIEEKYTPQAQRKIIERMVCDV